MIEYDENASKDMKIYSTLFKSIEMSISIIYSENITKVANVVLMPHYNEVWLVNLAISYQKRPP